MIIGSICSNVVYDICIYVLLFVYNLVSPFKELFNCRSFPRACLTLLFVLYWNTWHWKINRRSAQAWKDVVILLSLSHSTHVWSYHANFIDPSRHLRILGTCFTFLKSKHTKLCKGIMRMPKLLELQNGTNTESPQIIGKSSSTSPSSTLQIQVFILSSLRVPVVFFTWMTVVFLIPSAVELGCVLQYWTPLKSYFRTHLADMFEAVGHQPNRKCGYLAASKTHAMYLFKF